MAKGRACGRFFRLYASNRTRNVVFFIVNNNEYKLGLHPCGETRKRGRGRIDSGLRPPGGRAPHTVSLLKSGTASRSTR